MSIWLAVKPANDDLNLPPVTDKMKQIYKNNLPKDAKYKTTDTLDLNKYYAIIKITQIKKFNEDELIKSNVKMNAMEQELLEEKVAQAKGESEEKQIVSEYQKCDEIKMTVIAYGEIIVLDEPVAFSGDDKLIQSVPVDDVMQIIKDISVLKANLKSQKLGINWFRFLSLSIDQYSIMGMCSKIHSNIVLFGNVKDKLFNLWIQDTEADTLNSRVQKNIYRDVKKVQTEFCMNFIDDLTSENGEFMTLLGQSNAVQSKVRQLVRDNLFANPATIKKKYPIINSQNSIAEIKKSVITYINNMYQ
eukprot:24840_1